MSILHSTKVIVEFNGGDIATAIGSKNGIGYVGFHNLEKPQEIGTDVKESDYIFPVQLMFHKTESIDVVIKQLKAVKKKMQKNNNKEE